MKKYIYLIFYGFIDIMINNHRKFKLYTSLKNKLID